MKSWLKLTVFFTLVIGIISVSCRRIDEYPPEPSIKFMEFEKVFNSTDSVYDRGILKFEYTDGDGDLGLEDSDTFPPFNPESKYYYNLIIDFYELQNGVETEVPLTFFNPGTQEFDTISLSARIPLLVPKNVQRSISGDIFDSLFIYNYNSDFDTLFFKFYIIDRALNESNVEKTPYIVRKYYPPNP
jgi:hypothetical protein